jgi:DeoR/GlpR family transcriptional regulator of sugar metabolism
LHKHSISCIFAARRSANAGRPDVLAEERQNQILALVNAHRSITAAEIQRRLKVSHETVRRDLLALEQRGHVRRAHGGAVAVESSEPALAIRQVINAEEKGAIGRRVAEIIPDGAAVMLAGGTTVQSVAEALTIRSGLTVVTNCVGSCLKLIGRNANRVHLLGGELQPQNQATLGRDATEMLGKYYADFAVIGAGGISPHGEIMDYTREEAELSARMMQSAKTVIVVADHTKFGRIAPARVKSLEAATYLVTDAAPEPAMAEILGHLPVEVLVAPIAR